MLTKGLLKPGDVFRPFLFSPKILDQKEFFIYDSTIESYRIQLHEESIGSNVLQEDKELQLLKKLPFDKDTKDMYYAVFDMYGTHFVREVSFGQKGEFSWQLDHMPSKKRKQFQESFKEFCQKWKNSQFNTLGTYISEEEFQAKAQSLHIYEEKIRLPHNFPFNHQTDGFQIGFQVQPIYTLIQMEKLREEMKKALVQYIHDKSIKPVDGKITNEIVFSNFFSQIIIHFLFLFFKK